MCAELRPAAWSDLERVYALAAALDTRLFGAPEFELAHLRNAWERPSFDPGRDAWVAVERGDVVAYAGLVLGGEVVLWLGPGRTEASSGGALLELLEGRAAEGGSRRLVAIVPSADEAAGGVFRAGGFRMPREVWRMAVELRRQPPAPRWPDGVSVRPYDPARDAAAVHALLVEAFAASEETIPPFEDWRSSTNGDPSFEPGVWFLAEFQGAIVGVALCWEDGFVKDIAVLPAWRRQGLGEALLRHAIRELHRRGARTVALKVDSGNPTGAVRLYERAGMRVHRRYGIYEKDL